MRKYARGERGMKQESFYAHFFGHGHLGIPEEIEVKIIDHCDSNDQERRESFWSFHLKTMAPWGLNEEKIVVKRRRKNR